MPTPNGTAASALRTALWLTQQGHTESFATELAWSHRDALDHPEATPANKVIVADLIKRAYLPRRPNTETLRMAARLIEAQPVAPAVDDSAFQDLTA